MRIRRLGVLLGAWLACATPASAQILNPTMQSVTVVDSGVACSVNHACASWLIGNAPTVAMQITGTFTGTLTFEGSADGLTWFNLAATNLATGGPVLTTTTTGQFTLVNSGILGFRVRATAAITGGANVSLTKGTASSATKAPAGFSLTLAPTLFAALGTRPDGTILWCSDCTVGAVCAGAGTGAFARRIAGVWNCS